MTDAKPNSEFAFMDAFPAAPATKQKGWDLVEGYWKFTRRDGLVPVRLVASGLEVSTQRIHQFIADGRLEARKVWGMTFITFSSAERLYNSHREKNKGGRPPKD